MVNVKTSQVQKCKNNFKKIITSEPMKEERIKSWLCRGPALACLGFTLRAEEIGRDSLERSFTAPWDLGPDWVAWVSYYQICPDGSLWPKPTLFSPHKIGALSRDQHSWESSNTASFVNRVHSETKNAWTVRESYTEMTMGEEGPFFLFPTPTSIGLFSHFKVPDIKNVPLWSGGLQRIGIFICKTR